MATVKTTAEPIQKGLRIVARPPTFRRAGFAFSAEPTIIPFSKLSEAQVELLKKEGNLVVSEADIPAPAEPASVEAAK